MTKDTVQRESKFNHAKFIKHAEKEIEKLLMSLNDSLKVPKNSARGLWMTGGLNKGNTLEITYNQGHKLDKVEEKKD